MLSILIPVFNYDIRELTQSLHEQAQKIDIAFEIRVYDDCSTNLELKTQNESIAPLAKVVYKKLSQNLGFCKIRNLLAEEAQYENLLFLDSDVAIINDDFIQKYLDLSDGKSVYCGGMQYQTKKPIKDEFLKWTHGKAREEASPTARNKNPHRTFWAGNFFIQKTIYLSTRFDDGSENYGYNDTMFGYKLLVHNIQVIHIDNLAFHKGLMSANKFVNRSLEAVENLLFFEKQAYIQPSFYQFIKVFKYYKMLKTIHLDKLYLWWYKRNKTEWIANLKSDAPVLRKLDKLKLGRLVEVKK